MWRLVFSIILSIVSFVIFISSLLVVLSNLLGHKVELNFEDIKVHYNTDEDDDGDIDYYTMVFSDSEGHRIDINIREGLSSSRNRTYEGYLFLGKIRYITGVSMDFWLYIFDMFISLLFFIGTIRLLGVSLNYCINKNGMIEEN